MRALPVTPLPRPAIPALALLVLAPACYDDPGSADAPDGGDGGPLTRPDPDAARSPTDDAGGGRPETGEAPDATADAGGDAASDGEPREDSGTVEDLSGAAQRFATVGCEGLRQCDPEQFSYYYTALGECVYERSSGLADYLSAADADCVEALAEYVDCVEEYGECLLGEYYGYEIEYFGVEGGACDAAKLAFGAACDVDVSG